MPVINHSHSRDEDQEDQVSRPAWEKDSETFISTNKLGMVVHLCNLS
jgi:hypothetical protein